MTLARNNNKDFP